MDCDCKLLLIFKATVISEYASFTNEPNTITTSRGDKYTADHIVVAVGGEPTRTRNGNYNPPFVPGYKLRCFGSPKYINNSITTLHFVLLLLIIASTAVVDKHFCLIH